jgi:secretion/DNA translocation related CpaE-like protein
VSRPLLVTADPDVLDDLLRLTALAGVEAEVAAEAATARASWESAACVLVGADVLDSLVAARLPRRERVSVVGVDLDDATIWQRGLALGVERVVFLPEAESWLVAALADAVEGGRDGAVVAVIGGRGGAGATTLACGLALTAQRRGLPTLLVDGDPLGGGIDLVFGGEHASGVRWPDLVATRGRVPAAALEKALPRLADLAVLSWDRGQVTPLAAEAVQAVLAAGRRSHGLVVVDLPRVFDDAAREVLALATTTLLVVPAEVRAVAAAGRVAAQAAALCRDVRLVVRGPAPAGLEAAEIERALSLQLAAELRPEPGLCRGLEEGIPPASARNSPLASSCHDLLEALFAPPAARRSR